MNTFTRPPPPQGAPPAYAMVTKVYRRSLRPVVVGATVLAAIWTLVWGVDSFKDISIDKNYAAKLEIFDIVLGSLYMATLAVELLGLLGAAMQSLRIMRIFAILSLGAAVIVSAAQLILVIIHFVFKDTLINECIALANGEGIGSRFSISSGSTTIQGDVSDFCHSAWSHDSVSEIAWFIVVALMSVLFSSIAFAYYRQLLDPTSVVNTARAPVAQHAPDHYTPPYAGGAFAYAGGAGGYAPPPGPPPAQSQVYVPQYDAAKLPEYERGGYLDTSDDKKMEDLKGGVDPFADFESQRGSGEIANAARRV
ncbi:hypothetical protein M0805_000266 [Coniferiporia weirii]|nr:hypothetical protein M0805_000266 [Coniferiporia weirii]